MTDPAKVKKALEVNRAVYEAVRTAIRPGVTERDIYELTARVVDVACGEVPHEFIGDFVGGERAEQIGGGPSDYALRAGDTFILDLSVRYDDTWSDTCRTYFLGEPGEEKRAAYGAALGAMKLGEQLVRAGAVGCEVKRRIEAFLSERGYGGLMPHHAGHAIGPAPYMEPAFKEGCALPVKSGDIFTLEPGIYTNGWGLRIENDYLAGISASTLLFDYPLDIEYYIV